jgi:hypothetical protein
MPFLFLEARCEDEEHTSGSSLKTRSWTLHENTRPMGGQNISDVFYSSPEAPIPDVSQYIYEARITLGFQCSTYFAEVLHHDHGYASIKDSPNARQTMAVL